MRVLPLVPVLAVALSACAGVPLPRESLTDPGALLFNGYTKPKVDCFRCHNGNGQGASRGPNLAPRVPKKSDERLAKVIREGEGFMPKYKDDLTDEEVTQVIAWMRASFPQSK
ncbi:MAG: cytochrome c [Myxococcales bacterium]|nr:cytochrome c [Myxococcales bacterium]